MRNVTLSLFIAVATLTLALAAFAGPATLGAGDSPDAQSDAGNDVVGTEDAQAPIGTVDAGVVVEDAAPSEAAAEAIDAGADDANRADAPSEPSEVGFSAGLRLGYAAPFGNAKAGALSDAISSSVPVGIEAGYFLSRKLYLGAYVSYGFATNGNDASSICGDATVICNASQWRFGAAAHYHFMPDKQLTPWAGVALGYDLISLTTSDATSTDNSAGSLHGLEASVLAGLDYKPLPYLGVGPYVELSGGHYTGSDSATSLHGWVTLGARFRTGL